MRHQFAVTVLPKIKRFLVKYMPDLADYFHYRHLDVSTLKELAARWKPEILDG